MTDDGTAVDREDLAKVLYDKPAGERYIRTRDWETWLAEHDAVVRRDALAAVEALLPEWNRRASAFDATMDTEIHRAVDRTWANAADELRKALRAS